jgi:hypothetical protein
MKTFGDKVYSKKLISPAKINKEGLNSKEI